MLGIDDIRLALRAAGLEIRKVENNRLNVGVHADEALTRALNDRLDDAWGISLVGSKPVDPRIVVEPKGPRPYHTGRFFREGVPPRFVGIDVARDGDETVVTRAHMRADGVIEVIAQERHKSDCATHNEPAMPNGPCDCDKEPCPVERMEDEGGPASGTRDWDDFPKVGLSKPVDIMAITRSLSGG